MSRIYRIDQPEKFSHNTVIDSSLTFRTQPPIPFMKSKTIVMLIPCPIRLRSILGLANIHQMEERHLVKEWDPPALLRIKSDAYLINSCFCKMVAFTILDSKSKTVSEQ